MIKIFKSTLRARLLLLLFALPAAILFIGVGTGASTHGDYLMGAAFVAAALLLALFVVFQVTLRVEMDEQFLTRSWLWGRTVIPLSEIHRLTWGGSRGVLILTIRYAKKKFVQLSTNAFTEQELREIHKNVLVSLGLEGEPLLPLFAEQVGYVDIDEMIARKRR